MIKSIFNQSRLFVTCTVCMFRCVQIKDMLYKSSSVCLCADSRLLLPFNIPLNRPVYATTSTLWLLPALSFCTRTISVYVYDDLCRVAKCVCVQCYTIWSMIKGKRNGHKKNPWPSSRYLCALFFSSSACACAFCKEQYRTAGPFCWSLSGVCSRIKPVVKVIYSCGSPFVWNLFF